jgi:hypothetical protein
MDCDCPLKLLANLVLLIDLPNPRSIYGAPTTTFGDAQSILL